MKFSPFRFQPVHACNFVTKEFNPNAPKFKKFKPLKLCKNQKEFGSHRSTKLFSRFGKGIVEGTGINPDQAYFDFIKKDPIKPFNNGEIPIYHPKVNLKIDNPLKWSLGCTYRCNDERLLPKKDRYRNYVFINRTVEEQEKYRENFLSTDHISIKIPKKNNYDENNNEKKKLHLNIGSIYGAHAESNSFWIPMRHSEKSVSNRSGVKYNIITNLDNDKYLNASTGILDKTSNNKKKGIAEFSDFQNPMNPNYNKRYQKLLSENQKLFYPQKGIFSNLYDSATKNGGIFMPFKSENKSK